MPLHLCAPQILHGQLGLNLSLQREAMNYDEVTSHHKVCGHADVYHIHSPVSSSTAPSLSDSKVFVWNIIQPNHWLVGIFHIPKFSMFLFHADFQNTAEDSPRIIHIHCYLRCKLIWLILLCTQDHVFGRVSDMSTGHKPRIIIK